MLPVSRLAQIGIGREFVSGGPSFPDGWSYRKSLSLSRASGAVTDYQIKLTVHRSSGSDSGADVYIGTNCEADYDDIRFTTSDGETLLDYWIEVSDSDSATIWIEFNSIGTGATTFYMYYGKADASAVSSGANTFPLFDDFPGTSLGAEWTSSGTASVADSVCTIRGGSGTDSKIIGTTTFAQNYAMRAKIKVANAPGTTTVKEGAGFRSGGTGECSFTMPSHTSGSTYCNKHYNYDGGTANGAITGGINANVWAVWQLIRNSTTSVIFSQDDAEAVTVTDQLPDNSHPMEILAGQTTAAYIYIDWVLWRKYQATEPAWGSWGSEEAL